MKSLKEALVHKHMDRPRKSQFKDNPNSEIDWPKLNRILSSTSTYNNIANKVRVSPAAVAAVCSMIQERCPDIDGITRGILIGFLSGDAAENWCDEDELKPYRDELDLDGNLRKFGDLCDAIADLI